MQAEHWQSLALGCCGVLLTAYIAGLRPEFTDKQTTTSIPSPTLDTQAALAQSFAAHHPVSIHSNKQGKPAATADRQSQRPEALELQLLNELLSDFFTTDFNELQQAKWQQHLLAGSPFLAELADYLKLDQIYGLELHQINNRSLSEEYWRQHKSSESYNANIFSLLLNTETQLWPLSLFTNPDLNQPVARVLLNHYDRAFLSKIEAHALALTLQPLAKGIERLLAYHMRRAVQNNSPLRLSRYQNGIDEVVASMVAKLGRGGDLFPFYQLVLASQWQEAATWLIQSERLNQSKYRFLYDLLATEQPSVLIKLASFEVITQQPQWWQQFLHYELCIGSHQANGFQLGLQLGISLPCSSQATPTTLQQVSANRDRGALSQLLNRLLQSSQLTAQDLQNFIGNLPAASLNELRAVNSHTLLDQMAHEGQLKLLRSTQSFRQLEQNYQLWRSYLNLATTDSFFPFAAVHHWYSNERAKKRRSINQEMPRIIQQLSPLVRKRLAQSLLEYYETGLVTEQNWASYQALVPSLSHNERQQFHRLSQLEPWLAGAQSSTTNEPERLTEQTLKSVIMHDLYQTLDRTDRLDEFLQQALLVVANHRLQTSYSDRLALLTEDGQLSSSTSRELTRIWLHHKRSQ